MSPKRDRSAPKRRARNMAPPKRNRKTEFICAPCRHADKQGTTHPGMMHDAGICDCSCRD